MTTVKEDAYVEILIQASIKYESLAAEHRVMRKHFYFALDALAVFLETEQNRDVDTVEQYLEAARFANSLGRRYPLQSLTEWLENETNK